MGVMTGRYCRRLLITSLFVVLSLVSITDASSCNRGCPRTDGSILQYKSGNVYEYNFDSLLTVNAAARLGKSAETPVTELKVGGSVKLFADGNCGYTIQLGNVKVTSKPDNVDTRITQNIQKPIHFTLVDGAIQPEICSDPNDDEYTLNIKRAIASLFQVNEHGKLETDVFGKCVTHTSSVVVGAATLVSKVRNLNDCSHRERIRSGILADGVVNEEVGIKTTPLLSSDYKKDAEVENGIVVSVKLVENYQFGSGVKLDSLLQARVITNLKIKKPSSPSATPDTGKEATSIYFQPTGAIVQKNLPALKTALDKVVKKIESHIQKDTAKDFIELIRLMRSADTETLVELADAPHPNKVLARKAFLDGLYRVGTTESAHAVLKLLNKLEEKQKVLALLSLNLIQRVDKNTLHLAVHHLTANALKQSYLVLGRLIGLYCQQHSCSADASITAAAKKFVENLKHCKSQTRADEDRIVYVLKGIANSGNGNLSPEIVVPALNECANLQVSTRIRVNALQAFATVSCDVAVQQNLLSVLSDQTHDSEVRIEAYLALVTCPNEQLVQQIGALVNAEPVNQVGGFIVSHVRSLRDSTDATRSEQRRFFSQIHITKDFPILARRNSYNNEVSYNVPALGLSASLEERMIYSQKGLLPRSGHFNLTAEFFGHDFNLLEINMRQENLEQLLEHYLGPKGVLNGHKMSNGIPFAGIGGAAGRSRRSVTEDAAKVAKKYNTYGQRDADVNFDMSLKLFGSEMLFLSLGDYIPTTLAEVIDHFNEAHVNVRRELKGFEKQFQFHTMFLDTKLQYPTGAGIALDLDAQGFAANRLDVAVNMNIDALIAQDWAQSDVRVKLVPSTDIRVYAQLKINAYSAVSGIRLDASAYSAAGSDVTLKLVGDKNAVHFDIELPREKLDLIDVQLRAEAFIGEPDKPERTTSFPRQATAAGDEPPMCFNQLESLGFQICFESTIGHTEGAHPLPQQFAVYVLTERHIAVVAAYMAGDVKQWRIDYSTPQSKVNHAASLTLDLLGLAGHSYARLNFAGTQKQLAVEAGFNNNNAELVIYARFEHDNEKRQSRIGFLKNGNEYRPVLELLDGKGMVSNEIFGYQINGRIVVDDLGNGKSYKFDNLEISNPVKNIRNVVNGNVDLVDDGYKAQLHVSNIGHSGFTVNSDFGLTNGVLQVGLFVNDDAAPTNVWGGSVVAKIIDGDYNIQLVGKYNAYELTAAQMLKYTPKDDGSIANHAWQTALTLKNKQETLVTLKLNGKTVGTSNVEVTGELGHGRKMGSLSIRLEQHDNAVVPQYGLDVNVKYSKHFIDARFHSQPAPNGNHASIDYSIATSWGTALSITGEVGRRLSHQELHIDIIGSAQLSSKDKPTKVAMKAVGNGDKTTTEFKLVRADVEWIRYTGDAQFTTDKLTAGHGRLNVKDLMQTYVEIKLNKNGKGELTAVFEITPPEFTAHKIDVASKFHMQAPSYNVDTTVTLDDKQQFHVKTDNVFDKQKFSTKTILELPIGGDRQFKFDATGTARGEWVWNGEVNGDFALMLPHGHTFDGRVQRRMSTNLKTAITQGSAELHLNEHRNDGATRTFVVNANVNNLNWGSKLIDETVQVIFTGFDGKHLTQRFHVKNEPKNTQHNTKSGSKKFDFDFSMEGDLLQHSPVQLKLIVDGYNSRQEAWHTLAAYGDLVNLQANGNVHLAAAGQPSTFEATAQLQAPQSQFKTFSFHANGKVMRQSTTAVGNEDNSPYLFEVSLDERTGGDHHVRISAFSKGTGQQGNYNIEIEATRMKGPLKLSGNYRRQKDATANTRNCSHSAELFYGDQFLKLNGDLATARDELKLSYKIETSLKEVRRLQTEVTANRLGLDMYALHATADHNGQAYNIDSKVHRSTHKRGLELLVSAPQVQKPVTINWIYELLGERKGKLSVDISHLADIDFSGIAEAAYNDIDDFYLNANWRSEKLHLNDYELSARGRKKALTVELKDAQSTIIAGTATYSLKKEPQKAIIEGQGQLQYRGKPFNGNFKLMRQTYDAVGDQEIGFAYTVNGNLGPRNVVATLKMTNREVNAKLSVCEEHKQCINVQIQSIVSADKSVEAGMAITPPVDGDVTKHFLLMIVDLRAVGYPYEFEMQSQTLRSAARIQYNLDANLIATSGRKYQLLGNVHSQGSRVQLKLPSRELQFEVNHTVPASGRLLGHYESSIALWLDKQNRPTEVTRLTANADLVATNANVHGNVKFEHPSIRPLSVTGLLKADSQQGFVNAELTLDVFRKPDQQIVAKSRWQKQANANEGHSFKFNSEQSFRSTGLGIQHALNLHSAFNADLLEFTSSGDALFGEQQEKLGYALSINRKHLNLNVHGLQHDILSVVGDINTEKHTVKWQVKTHLLGEHATLLNAELQPSQAAVTLSRNNTVDIRGTVKLGKQLKIVVKNGNGKEVIHGTVGLDAANFLQTTYNSNREDIRTLLDTSTVEIAAESKAASEELHKRFANLKDRLEKHHMLMVESAPDLSPLQQDFQRHANAILKEIEQDEAFQKIALIIKDHTSNGGKIIKGISASLGHLLEHLITSFSALSKHFHEIFETVFIPAWEDFLSATVEITSELRVGVLRMFSAITDTVFDTFKSFAPLLNNYGKSLHEAAKPFLDIALDFGKLIAQATDELTADVKAWLAQVPTFEEWHTEWNTLVTQLRLGERLLELLNDIITQLHILPHTAETMAFMTKCQEFVQRKLRSEPLANEEGLLRELGELFFKALNSLWVQLRQSSHFFDTVDKEAALTYGLADIRDGFLSSLGAVDKFSALLTLRFSVLNFLQNEDWSLFGRKIRQHFRLGLLQHFDDLDLHAHVVDGHHFITFDGQHFAQAGNCRFILAQDYVDNNFTLIAQLNNGRVKTLTLIDRDQQFIEVNDATALKLNGKPVEYPLHSENMHAWRKLYTVTLKSEYGVDITCTNDLKVCHVDINLFYTSKLRGLLGNGNAEPYDDATKIDGTIAASNGEFVQNYALGKCTITTPTGEVPHDQICEDFFGYADNDYSGDVGLFWSVAWLVDVAPYRSACFANVAEVTTGDKDKKEIAACNVALSYVSGLRVLGISLPLPDRCLKCPGSSGQRDIDAEFTVKIPNNKADVVFVVDVADSPVLTNLIAPTITELRNTLKSRGFTDVNILVIAHNSTQKYAALLTSDNGKLNYNGNLADVHLNGPAQEPFLDESIFKIGALVQSLRGILPSSEADAYKLAVRYPFRAGAAKSIVSVRTKPLDNAAVLDYLRTYVSGSDAAILHAITPINALTLDGVPTEKIIGFNARLVATLDGGKDGRKRAKLQYEQNLGTEYVLMHNGWIFVTNSIAALPPSEQNKAVSQASNIIADSLFKTEVISDCKCSVAFNSLHAKHHCVVKSSNFVPNKKVKAA